MADYSDNYDGDIEEDEDEPCGNLFAPGSEECDWCQFSNECEKDYLAFIKHEERIRKGKE